MKPGDTYESVLRELDLRITRLRNGMVALAVSHFLLAFIVAGVVFR